MGASDEDELWRAAPRDFTKVRDALVAALAGDPARKAAVKALRRPPPQVWAWNRLTLDGDEAAEEAMSAVDEVAELLADEGRAPEALAQATARLRAAAAMLARRAALVASHESVGWAIAQDRALGTLVEALPWDAGAREAARRGHLPDAPAPVDPLEAMRVLASGETPRPAAPVEKPARGKKKAPTEEDEAAARAEREAKAAAAERAAHERALAQAERAHTAAASALAAARAEVERAERALAEAQRRADEALADERERAVALDEARARLTSH